MYAQEKNIRHHRKSLLIGTKIFSTAVRIVTYNNNMDTLLSAFNIHAIERNLYTYSTYTYIYILSQVDRKMRNK